MLAPMTMTADPVQIVEAGPRISRIEAKGGSRYRARIMGWEPGSNAIEGSSAQYQVDVVKRDFPEAFPVGTRMKANHDTMCEAGGDIRRVMARTISVPEAQDDGMYADIEIGEEWIRWVEQYGDIVGLSICAAGEPLLEEDEDGDMRVVRTEDGRPILKRFFSAEESPYNSIDFVEAPGADGRIVAALESAREHLPNLNIREQARFAAGLKKVKESKAIPPRSNGKENSMDEETRTAIVEAVSGNVQSFLTEQLDARLPVAEATEIQMEQVAEAAISEGLSAASRSAVYEKVRGGMSQEDAIAQEKARHDEIVKSLKESSVGDTFFAGTIHESGEKSAVTIESAADFDKFLEAEGII
ncbi:hypothetical protein CMP1-13 [Clavibacter phage CMP1]|uniref:Uncharacterized protein n=1 Tax=Clavibacter phage CMP1 TaxID=686439 RepID=D0U1Z7_9CAUD|nr:head maturation protease [Clavibacter phage CMP1]ACY35909.1 hypothetical protein CMP1-13 [Clavibacter phage CMP1]